MNKPVKFELAKLIKEKGFDKPCIACYDKCDMLSSYVENVFEPKNYNTSSFVKSAPTIAEVVMWLYEKHGIWISIFSDTVLNWESLFSIKIDWIYPKDSPDSEDIEPKYFNYKGDNEFNSPTEAYEAAIEYTLNNLI